MALYVNMTFFYDCQSCG